MNADVNWKSAWYRWLGVFTLIALGLAVFVGGDLILNSPNFFQAFLGYFLAQAVLFVLPGLIIGSIIGLVTQRNLWGLRVMIAINSLLFLGNAFGGLKQAGFLP